MEIDNIQGLINRELLEKSIEVNDDPYGGACVAVAINVMKHLDTFEGDFNVGYNPDMTTPHAIICECDDQGGITGFMAGAVRNMVCLSHEKGWKFWLADVFSPYDINDEDQQKSNISKVLECEHLNVTEEEATSYVQGLCKRFNESKE
jgi:hypothetical protein